MRALALLLLASGCATTPKTAIVDGRELPRLTLELNGQPYTVKHEGAHPQPGNPSGGLNDKGGSIRGRVCGVLVDFDATHKGDRVQVVGSLDNRMPAAIDVREDHGVRHFSGNLSNLGVDFTFDGQQMMGHVGTRVFALETRGDLMQGYLRSSNFVRGAIPIVLQGLAALREMPAADQAVVLPAIMTCQTASSQFNATEGMELGFGGQATDRPPETSSVYTHH